MIYFIFGCTGSSLLHLRGLSLVAASRGFSCCRAWALGTGASVVGAEGLQSVGSVVVVHGLSCSRARGVFPGQGWNPCLAGGFLSAAPPGKSHYSLFKGVESLRLKGVTYLHSKH